MKLLSFTENDEEGYSWVQGTNDFSIVSKCSMVDLGYFKDRFVPLFVNKRCRRSPIINRGYYIRAVAINHALESFLRTFQHEQNQIVSLGAGFDSAYFRLRDNGYIKNTTYVEVDFWQVLHRKLALIQQHQVLSDAVEGVSGQTCHDEEVRKSIVFNSNTLKLIGVDLKNLDLLTRSLEATDVDFSLPTLFLSEVVLTYLPPVSSTGLILWAAKHFRNSVFVSYEQVYPSDSFGTFMCRHFHTIGSPLKSIDSYPTISSQIQRFFKLGGNEVVVAADLNYFYHTKIDSAERQRIDLIEPFDEFEEWQMKCAHYIILTAFNGSCRRVAPTTWPELIDVTTELEQAQHFNAGSGGQTELEKEVAELEIIGSFGSFLSCWKSAKCRSVVSGDALHSSTQCLEACHGSLIPVQLEILEEHSYWSRFGHSATRLVLGGRDRVVVMGGFGVSSTHRRHCRLREIAILNVDEMRCADKHGRSVSPAAVHHLSQDAAAVSLQRMYHSACAIPQHSERILVIGGRQSPVSPATKDFVVAVDFPNDSPDEVSYQNMNTSGEVPTPRWRHSATFLTIKGEPFVFVFGGRTLSVQCTNDCYLLSCSTWSWSKISDDGSVPEPRHSHRSDLWTEDKIVISCGLSNDERVLSSLFTFEVACNCWQELVVAPALIPRYSHCSAISRDRLILVGGVSMSCLCPGIEVVNLASGSSQRISIACPKSEPLLMLHNNETVVLEDEDNPTSATKLLVVGGGGNCFSFGTHFNSRPTVLTIHHFT